jgi:hypothetical protein
MAHVDTAETSTTARYHTLTVQIRNSAGTVVGTVATYSNLDHNTGYTSTTATCWSTSRMAVIIPPSRQASRCVSESR